MNEEMDFLQEKLAQLEAGASLAEVLVGVPEEEAELLHLAASLREVNMPMRDATLVAAQRARLMDLAQKPTPAPSGPGFWQTVRAWLVGHPWVTATAVAAVLLVVLGIRFWPQGAANDPGTALSPAADPAPAAAVVTNPSATDISDAMSAQPNAPTSAALAEERIAAHNLHSTFLPLFSTPFMTTAEEVGLVRPVGLVQVQQADGMWTAVTRQSILTTGQHVRTGNLSSVGLLFFDGSQAFLGPNSELVLETVDAQPPAAGFRTVILAQLYGESEHQVQFRNDSGSRYEVKTPTGSGIARGTQFRVRVTADQQASFSVTEGRVDVSNAQRTVRVTAGQTTSFNQEEPPADPTFLISGEGVVTAIAANSWTVAGQIFAVDAETVILGNPQVGDYVRVEGRLLDDGTPYAEQIALLYESPLNRFSLTGMVDEISATAWVIAGQMVAVTAETIIDPDIALGDRVRVTGLILDDGQLEAERITRLEDPAELPFEFTGVVQEIGEETWMISGQTITLNGDTEIQGAVAVGDLVKVEGVILEGDVWLAEEIKLVAGEDATFSLVGILESMDPWVVAGVSFEVRPWTLIDEGLVVGELARVNGRILEDGTWVASEITRLSADDDALVIVFVGTVDSVDPWIINGLPLVANESSLIDEEIVVGSLVRVTAEIRDDGTWLIRELMLLSAGVEPGCVAITAVITNISNGQLTLSNGQTISLGEDVTIEGELRVGSVVVIIACANEDGTITILSITVIYDPGDIPTPGPGPDPTPVPGGGGQMVTICHKPGTPAEKTMTIPQSALNGHLVHGDTMGPCP